MDITQYKRKESHKVDIKDPHGQPTDIKVEIHGADSKEFRTRLADVARMYNDKFGEHNAIAITSLAAVKSWENVEGKGGPLDPESDEAMEIAGSDDFRWFFDQIWQVTNNRSLFFSKPDKS